MNAIWTFLQHLTVAQVLIAITGGCASLSVLNKYAIEPAFPRWGKFIGALCGALPGDLRTIINDVQKLITDVESGMGGDGPARGGSGSPDAKTEPPAPRVNRFSLAMLFGLTFAIVSAPLGCANFHPNVPPNAPGDVQGATDCVFQALLSNGDVGQCIVTYGPALIADALQALLDSTQFHEAHPELVPVAKDRLLMARRAQARGAVQ